MKIKLLIILIRQIEYLIRNYKEISKLMHQVLELHWK